MAEKLPWGHEDTLGIHGEIRGRSSSRSQFTPWKTLRPLEMRLSHGHLFLTLVENTQRPFCWSDNVYGRKWQTQCDNLIAGLMSDLHKGHEIDGLHSLDSLTIIWVTAMSTQCQPGLNIVWRQHPIWREVKLEF